MAKKDADKVEAGMGKASPIYKPQITPRTVLGTGSTLLNLACTGRIQGGLIKGGAYRFVGDSSTGKTWFTLAILAEACANKNFDDYAIIHDNAENGALMDVARYFGKRLLARMQPPRTHADGTPRYSVTVEEVYFNLYEQMQNHGPCIYVIDSTDVLTTVADQAKFKERIKANRKEKDEDISGSYGMAKAKQNSENMRQVLSLLGKTGSILIMVGQTRDKVGGVSFGPTKTAAGGHALKFYSHLEIWTSLKQTITKQIKGKLRQIGILVKIKTKKNRLSGKEWAIEVPLYWSAGVDDIGSCCDYLLSEGHWKLSGTKVNAEEFDLKLSKEALVRKIEELDKERELRALVGEVWAEIEEACQVKRKPKYE